MSKSKDTVLIIEDDVALAIKMEIYLTDWGYEVIDIFESGERALEAIKEKRPQFVLMDIKLAGHLTGIEVAQKIVDLDISVIFMTHMNNDETFEAAKKVKSISYLVKPFDMLTLKGSLEMAGNFRTINKESDSTILLRRGSQRVVVSIDSIIWIESDRNYCDIFTEQGRFSVRKSMVKFLDELSTDKIMKTHRQYAIALNKIDNILVSKGELVLIGGKVIPIGRTYKKLLIEAIKKR